MRNQTSRNRKRRLDRDISSTATRQGNAIAKRSQADQNVRRRLADMLGENWILSSSKPSTRPNLANYLTTQLPLPGGMVLYGMINGDCVIFASYQTGEAINLPQYGFEFISFFGWYSANPQVEGLVDFLSFYEGYENE